MARNRFKVKRVQLIARDKRLGIVIQDGFYPVHVTEFHKAKSGDHIRCEIFKYPAGGYGNRFGQIAGYIQPGSIRKLEDTE